MKVIPFGKNIAPSCEYCEFGQKSGQQIYCNKKGEYIEDKKCMKYKYDPTKRIPRVLGPMPKYNPEDFEL